MSGSQGQQAQQVREVFEGWLHARGWKILQEHGTQECIDIEVWHPDGARLLAEVKSTGCGIDPGEGVDSAYGRLLRRMTDGPSRYAVVVPEDSVAAALGVPARVRQALALDVYVVDRDGQVRRVDD